MLFTKLSIAQAGLTGYDQVTIQTWVHDKGCKNHDYYGEQEYPDTGVNQQFTAPGLPSGVVDYDIEIGSGDTLPTMWACPSNTAQGDYTNCVELTQGMLYTGTGVLCTSVSNGPQIQIQE